MPYGILTPSMCKVNEISTNKCTPNSSFDDLDINDVLENIRILLNYIKKQRELQSRARMGGWAKHALDWGLSLPAKKSAFAFLQKIFGSYFAFRILNLRHGASSLRGA